ALVENRRPFFVPSQSLLFRLGGKITTSKQHCAVDHTIRRPVPTAVQFPEPQDHERLGMCVAPRQSHVAEFTRKTDGPPHPLLHLLRGARAAVYLRSQSRPRADPGPG